MVNLIDRKNCPLCGAKDGHLLVQLPFHEGPVHDLLHRAYSGRSDHEFQPGQMFAVYQCPHCSFLWQRWVLDEAGMHLLYDKWIDPGESFQKNRTHQANYYRPLFFDVLFVTRLFPGLRPHQIKVLDFGMGWGGWARVAMAMGLDVFGAELSRSRIEFARSLGLPLVDDWNSLQDSFDYINTEQVLEHVADLHEVMALLSRTLKKGGLLRFSVPTVRRELSLISKGRWKPAHDAFHPAEHINGFSWPSIRLLAKKHGFEIAPAHFFAQLAIRSPSEGKYALRRLISHFFFNNVLLIKK